MKKALKLFLTLGVYLWGLYWLLVALITPNILGWGDPLGPEGRAISIVLMAGYASFIAARVAIALSKRTT